MRTVRRSSWEQGIRINYVAPCYIKSAIRTVETERRLIGKGVEFGVPEDVASCMMRIAADREMNGEFDIWIGSFGLILMDVGHSLMIVPRSVAKEGFIDPGLDDFVEEGLMKSFQEAQLRAIEDRWLDDHASTK